MDLWNAAPETLVRALRDNGLRRAYVVTDPTTGALTASHPVLAPLVETLRADRRDFRQHEGCFFDVGRESGHLLAAFVHSTCRGQAAGGVRFWNYATVDQLIRDGLRLSRGMGHKCALAGLWWGGGKGIIVRDPRTDHTDPRLRRAVYRDYGRFITSLRGCYVTAEDVGTTTDDMAWIFETTRHTTCIPEELGGSGNPSVLTATGVVVAMEAALEHLGLGTLAGKTVAMQGLGNVARYMIQDLLDRGVGRIVGADIDPRAIAGLAEHIQDSRIEARLVAPSDTSILAEPCDILAPNGVGAILNPQTIPAIQARIICGAANNQLEDSDRDGAALRERGSLYVPDFLANRMGIVNCANEQYGVFAGDPAIHQHLRRETPHGVFQRCLDVFRRAAASGRTTAEEAVRLADELMLEPHPIWGHRGQRIIQCLVDSHWETGL